MSAKSVFITGASGFIGKYVLGHYLAEPDCDLYLLQRRGSRARLERFIEARVAEPEWRARVHILEGDVTAPQLGLDGPGLDMLRRNVTHVFHLAAVYDLVAPRAVALRVNVEGARNVLDAVSGCRQLQRFGYMSTIAISGMFRGTYTEDDFDVGQGFKNAYDETKFLAEKLVRERRADLPTVICRPTVVVGDSKTGAFEKIDGPYHALVTIARNVHLVVQDSGAAKCHMVPVDFVADACCALFEDAEAVGGVYHVGDPQPMTYNAFIDLVCAHWGKMKPLLRLPPAWVRPMFYLPLFRQITGVTLEAFRYSYHPVEYDMSKALALLKKHGLTCPPALSYFDTMLEYFMAHRRDPDLRWETWRSSAS